MIELKIVDILDKHGISWSWFGNCVFVGKERTDKIKKIAKELIKIKSIRQGFDKEGNYIAFDKRKL